jgi:hypothetical protein
MQAIFSSASKIVFILMATALVVLTYIQIVEAKDFVMLAGMAFTYYFTRNTPPNTDTAKIG